MKIVNQNNLVKIKLVSFPENKISNQIKQKDKMKEQIICAAVWYKEIPIKKEIPFESTNPNNCPIGLVFSGHRHGQCIYTKCAVTGLRDCESGENEQGFLTSKNRFVSRKEALIIALKENQVMDIKEVRGNELFSEDLY